MRLPRIGLTFLTLITAFVETPKSLNLITPWGASQALAQTPVNWKVETNRLVPLGIKPTQISQRPSASAETKVSQCNRIIEIANEAVSKAKTITSNGNGSEPAAMLSAAEAMENAAEKMKQVSLGDPILQGLRSRFIVMYEQTSPATRDFVRAFQAKNRPEAEAALQRLQAATSPEKQLVDEINNYCGSKGRNPEAERLLEQGNQQLESGKLQAAIQFFQQALIISRKINDRSGEGEALGHLGNAYHALEDYTKAIEYYEQSLAIAQEINDHELEKLVQEGLSQVQKH